MRIFLRPAIALLLAISVIAACGQKSTEITYTTDSPEAKKLFLEGLAQNDQLQIDRARGLFNEAIQADSTFAMAYYYRAQTAVSAAEFRENLKNALKYVDKVSEPERLLIMSMDANSKDNPGEARRFLETLVDLMPESKRAHYQLGVFYYGQQDWSGAERELAKATAIDSSFAPAYNILAYAYSNQRKYPEAIEALQKYSELRPDDPNPHDSMGETYLYMGEYDNSINQYQNALELDPTFNFSHAGIGHNYAFTGQFDKARQQYEYFITQAKSTADTNTAYFWDAVSYVLEDEYEKAIGVLESQLDFAGAHDNVVLQGIICGQIANIYLVQGDYENALKEAEKVRGFSEDSRLQAGNREALLRQCDFTEAQAYSYLGKKSEAQNSINEYQRSAEVSGGQINMLNWHGLVGIVAYIDKDYSRAAEEFNKSNSQAMYQQYFYGLTEEALGNKDKATDLFKRIAGWNRNGLVYALVRNKARAKLLD